MVVSMTSGVILPPINQQSLADGLKQAFSAAGYAAPFSEYDYSDEKHIVYRIVNDAQKDFGTIYYLVKVLSNLEISQNLNTAFDVENNLGSNQNYSSGSNSYGEEMTIRWIALNNGNEFKWVLLYQDYRWACLGMLRPQGMPDFWDEDIAPFCAVSRMDRPLEVFDLSDINPYSSENDLNFIKSSFGQSGIPISRNPFNNQIDIITRLLFTPGSNEGMFGTSSPMLGLATVLTLEIGDTIALPDGQEYIAISPPGSLAQCVVRVV